MQISDQDLARYAIKNENGAHRGHILLNHYAHEASGAVSDRLAWALTGPIDSLSARLERRMKESLARFPYPMQVTDWEGRSFSLGGQEEHWSGESLHITLKTAGAARDILSMDGLRFLERYLVGEVDIDSGIFLLHDVRDHLELGSVKWWQFLGNLGHNLLFQNVRRASVNVQSHYDIPQGCLDRYLDQVYFSYSCGMFEDVEPARYSVRDLNRIGSGEKDDWDSLEKAQWRKFHDSLSYLNPRQGESVLDIGAGYFGYAKLALEMFPDMGRIVGWTHSKNQVARGRELLQARDPGRYEVRYGDYREEGRVFDHVNSIGMVCHVGPRGLEPYVRNVRQRIRKGGRYLHHCMMSDRPVVLDNFEIGVVFNKRYVWPGFQYFPVTDHIHALQRNGFRIEKFVDLSDHYAKTVYAWARRFEAHIETMREHMTEPTVRAWRVYMAATGSFLRHRIITGRMYAVAV